MIGLYYLGFALLLLVAGPVLLLQKKARAGLAQKFGQVPESLQHTAARLPKTRVWFHAVSVGEFNAIFPLLNSFRAEHPEIPVFVSTTTATGQALAQEKVGAWANVFYFPFDLPFATNAWLDAVQPQLVVIAETELWPGFTQECKKRAIPICCVNGRISPRSFKNYSRLKPFFKPVLAKFAAFGVQSQDEALRFRSLGAPPEATVVTGNMKFDGVKPVDGARQAQLMAATGLREDEFVIVAGSTHESEEAALLSAIKAIKQPTRLILVPRHPERFDRVCQIVTEHGFRARRQSRHEKFTAPDDVYVLDTIGQLMAYYSLATVAFVGGTIAPIGGHSLIEPFAYGTPVICGPHTEKTKDVAKALLQRSALVQVKSAEELPAVLERLINSREERAQLGSAGGTYVRDSQGAVARTMNLLNGLLGFNNDGKPLVTVGRAQ